MTIPINKLNMSNNSQFLSKSRLTSFDHLKRWNAVINSSLSSIQTKWNNTLYPLLSTLPQLKGIDAWINGFDGKALYIDRVANSSNNRFYNFINQRPKSIKESMEDVQTSLDEHVKDVESIKKRIQKITKEVTDLFTLAGDVTGSNNNNTVEKIQNRNVTSDTPVDQYVLAWNDGNSNWTPTNKFGEPPLPEGFVSGLNMTYSYQDGMDDYVTIFEGVCRSDDDTTNIELTADTTIKPRDYLDTGPFAGTKYYYLWIFYDPTGDDVDFRFSLQYPGSGTDPIAPSAAYTKKRYLGSILVRQLGSLEFVEEFRQAGKSSIRTYIFDRPYRILDSGNSLTWTKCSHYDGIDFYATLTGQNMTSIMADVQLLRIGNYKSSDSTLYIRSEGSSSTDGSLHCTGRYNNTNCHLHILGDGDIEYKASDTGVIGVVEIAGYIESI